MSPFRRITQQLGALDLKSPELEDFATPLGPAPDLWPKIRSDQHASVNDANVYLSHRKKSPSATDINTIVSIQNSVHNFNQTSKFPNPLTLSSSLPNANNFSSLPFEPRTDTIRFSETHFDVNGDIQTENKSPDRNFNRSREDFGPQQQNALCLSNEALAEEMSCLGENPSIILGHNGAFLDTKAMSSNPSANYYRPTEEPEPLDLTQLNIEASVMCLVSKVKFLCGRCGSPAVRLRQPRNSIKREGFNTLPPDVVTSQPISTDVSGVIAISVNDSMTQSTTSASSAGGNKTPIMGIKSKDLNLALTQAVGEVTSKVKKGNKFTDGLDLSMTTDWASELRPSMRKLRQAMDGLLKTARLMHSVQRLQQDSKKISMNLTIMFRRDVCFSQAVSFLNIEYLRELLENKEFLNITFIIFRFDIFHEICAKNAVFEILSRRFE